MRDACRAWDLCDPSRVESDWRGAYRGRRPAVAELAHGYYLSAFQAGLTADAASNVDAALANPEALTDDAACANSTKPAKTVTHSQLHGWGRIILHHVR